MQLYSPEELNKLIGEIYDCAVDPELWKPTLTRVRDRLERAAVAVMFMDKSYVLPGSMPQLSYHGTEWSSEYLSEAHKWMPMIPSNEMYMTVELDHSFSQLQQMPEEEFHKTEFYQQWVKPQGLRDNSMTMAINRGDRLGALVTLTYENTPPTTDAERQLFSTLSPHIRRSLMISGIVDEGKHKLQLYRELLDRVKTAVMIVSHDAKLVYANEHGERLLSDGSNITTRHGKVLPANAAIASGFSEALARACAASDSLLGTHGNGIPLPSKDKLPAVCYVLPLGTSERRRSLGPGLAAIFVSTHATSVPPSLEVLSALCGLTAREARVALMIADGMSQQEAAIKLNVSLNTLHTHLTHAYQKTATSGQQDLAKFVSKLSLSITSQN